MRFFAALLAFAVLLLFASPVSAREKQAITDDHIHDEGMRRLAGDADVKGGNIEVGVKDGAVTLRGRVDGPKQRAKAEKLVKKVRGVRSVNNQLTVAQP